VRCPAARRGGVCSENAHRAEVGRKNREGRSGFGQAAGLGRSPEDARRRAGVNGIPPRSTGGGSAMGGLPIRPTARCGRPLPEERAWRQVGRNGIPPRSTGGGSAMGGLLVHPTARYGAPLPRGRAWRQVGRNGIPPRSTGGGSAMGGLPLRLHPLKWAPAGLVPRLGCTFIVPLRSCVPPVVRKETCKMGIDLKTIPFKLASPRMSKRSGRLESRGMVGILRRKPSFPLHLGTKTERSLILEERGPATRSMRHARMKRAA